MIKVSLRIVSDSVTHFSINAKMKEVDEDTLDLKEYPVEMLLQDSRVTMDQSLLLINQKYLLLNDFAAEVLQYKNSDVEMNVCMHDSYEALASAVSEKFGEMPHAEIIMKNRMTLGSYLETFETGIYYEYDGYLITKQNADVLCLPSVFEHAVISMDNQGNWMITLKLS